MDEQYKKLKFNCRRGMLELDLLLKNYLDKNYKKMSLELKKQFELLLEYSDQELLSWLIMDIKQDNYIAKKIKLITANIIEFKNAKANNKQ